MFPDDADRKPIERKLPGKISKSIIWLRCLSNVNLIQRPVFIFVLNRVACFCVVFFFSAASMVVQRVKGLLYRLLKVPAGDLRLTYTSPKVANTCEYTGLLENLKYPVGSKLAKFKNGSLASLKSFLLKKKKTFANSQLQNATLSFTGSREQHLQ